MPLVGERKNLLGRLPAPQQSTKPPDFGPDPGGARSGIRFELDRSLTVENFEDLLRDSLFPGRIEIDPEIVLVNPNDQANCVREEAWVSARENEERVVVQAKERANRS